MDSEPPALPVAENLDELWRLEVEGAPTRCGLWSNSSAMADVASFTLLTNLLLLALGVRDTLSAPELADREGERPATLLAYACTVIGGPSEPARVA